MSYFILLPCLLALHAYVKSHGFPGYYFTVVAFSLTAIIASTGLMLPGADALLATSLSMCLFNVARLRFQLPPEPTDAEQPEGFGQTKLFCTQRTHDFAIQPADTDFAIDLLKAEKWSELAESLAQLNSSERQGFYANFDYSRLVERSDRHGPDNHDADNDAGSHGADNSVLNFTNAQPQSVDAHVLYGHSKLCEAKRLGLVPGAIPDEESARSLAVAFRHFRLALRIDPDNPEALCGLILAKGFTGLSDEHIEKSLQRLLSVDALHFHGLVAAACFLVNSNAGANRFVNIVERTVGENNATAAFARIVVHVECMIGSGVNTSLDSRAIADLHAQLRVYHRESAELGSWQQGICNNIVAYAFETIGDQKEKAMYLAEVKGELSPYPWQRKLLPGVVDEQSVITSASTPG